MGIAFPMTKRENKIWYFVFTDEKKYTGSVKYDNGDIYTIHLFVQIYIT